MEWNAQGMQEQMAVTNRWTRNARRARAWRDEQSSYYSGSKGYPRNSGWTWNWNAGWGWRRNWSNGYAPKGKFYNRNKAAEQEKTDLQHALDAVQELIDTKRKQGDIPLNPPALEPKEDQDATMEEGEGNDEPPALTVPKVLQHLLEEQTSKEKQQALTEASKARAKELRFMIGMSQESKDQAGMGKEVIQKWQEELDRLMPQPAKSPERTLTKCKK